MLRATDITYSVAGKTLISGINVCFPVGKLHLIIGPNGAGKSTLIKVLAGLLRPQKGVVEFDGRDIKGFAQADLAQRRAVLSQAIEIAFPMTVREVVMMGRYPHFGGRPGPSDEQIVDEMMDLFDVTAFGDRNYQTLSGGERQRVNFARVLAQLWQSHSDTERGGRYLFLDEPLTFLDISHQIDFMKKIRDFAATPDVVTVGVVHDLNLAARFADQIVLLNHGRIEIVGRPTEVLTPQRILDVFAVEPTLLATEAGGMHLIFD
jgi:iron complex transport system ATP-binding protein